ncbi:uncharacterized protein A4U43_C02F22700 [Asparagus officinalis]|uniref:Uncharacterized protein n=1 Tax=Asparagus officinalis TaxID=4686 RepID=A0A5P1FL50_ASPOF|nr:uncharacterized protein A4U43_C02F22700 [Asparagus officinalis]
MAARSMVVMVEEAEVTAWMTGGDCATPTAMECRIPEPMTCPPAPKKQRLAAASVDSPANTSATTKKKKNKKFFNPPNLEAAFAAAAASAPLQQNQDEASF